MSELIPEPEITNIEDLAMAIKNGQYIPATNAGGNYFNLIKVIEVFIEIKKIDEIVLYEYMV